MTPVYDVLLIGDYFFDMIYTGVPRMPTLGCELFCQDVTTTGGAMYITATALCRLGANVGWPATFGNDYYSHFVRDLAVREGIDLSLARHLNRSFRRVTTSLALGGERAFITVCDPDEPDLLQFWLHSMEHCRFKHLHFGGLMSLDESRLLIEPARRSGATVSMDCQDMPALNSGYPWRELLPLLDIFIPNARESMLLTGESCVQDALPLLAQHCKLVVVKDGANGAWAASDGEVIHSPAMPVADVLDTTGAGDCFNGGFLYGHVVERAPLESCLRYANICGGLSVSAVGGATAAPTLDQLRACQSNA